MYPVKVKIVSVFGVERRKRRNEKYTEFGFASENSKHYSLNVPGWPVIEAGMELTMLLERQDDWESLVGWANHTSGEIASPAQGIWIGLLILSIYFAIFAALSGPVIAGALPLFLTLMAGYRLRRVEKIEDELKAILPNKDPVP